MKVHNIMQGKVRVCSPDSDLAVVGKTMAEVGCGALPVVDENGHVMGMITDRDVCLAVAKRNRRPSEIRVKQVMGSDLYTCHPEDDIRNALESMRRFRVRRLPVVDESRQVVGILSLDDIVLHARAFEAEGFTGPFYTDIATTLRAICSQPTASASL